MRTLLIPTLLAVLAAPAAAQAPSTEASADPTAPRSSSSTRTTYHGRSRQLDVAVPRLPVDLKIDGSLDEPQWAEAAMLTGFSQYSPVDRLAAEDHRTPLVFLPVVGFTVPCGARRHGFDNRR